MGIMGKGKSGVRSWGQILEGPVSDAKEFGWYPGNDGKHFKFWMNVVRLTHASSIERNWSYEERGREK